MENKPVYDFVYSGFGISKNNLRAYVETFLAERRANKFRFGQHSSYRGIIDSMIGAIASNDFSFNSNDPEICKLLEKLITQAGYDKNGKYTDDARAAMHNICIAMGKDPSMNPLFDKTAMGHVNKLTSKFKSLFGLNKPETFYQTYAPIVSTPTPAALMPETKDEAEASTPINADEQNTTDKIQIDSAPAPDDAPAAINNADLHEYVLDEENEKPVQDDVVLQEYVLDEENEKPVQDGVILQEYILDEENEKTVQTKTDNEQIPSHQEHANNYDLGDEEVTTHQTDTHRYEQIAVDATDMDVPESDTTIQSTTPARKSSKKKWMYRITATVAGLAAVGASLFMTRKAADTTKMQTPVFKTVQIDTASHKTTAAYNLGRDNSNVANDSTAIALTRSSKSSLNILLGEKKADELCARVQHQIDNGIFVAPRGMSAERIAHAMEMSRIYEGKSVILDALESKTKLTPAQQAEFAKHIDEIGDMGTGIQKRMASKRKLSNHSQFNKAPKKMRDLHVKNIKQLHQLRQQMSHNR
ncbi:hypothetical protein HDR61_04060 [bacterium]|nr:hypothetical protein [bacterium]